MSLTRPQLMEIVRNLAQQRGGIDEAAVLDDVVHDAFGEMASEANNAGLEGQIENLQIVCGWSLEDILDRVNQEFDLDPDDEEESHGP